MYDLFSSVRTQLRTTNLSKGGAKVEVLGGIRGRNGRANLPEIAGDCRRLRKTAEKTEKDYGGMKKALRSGALGKVGRGVSR